MSPCRRRPRAATGIAPESAELQGRWWNIRTGRSGLLSTIAEILTGRRAQAERRAKFLTRFVNATDRNGQSFVGKQNPMLRMKSWRCAAFLPGFGATIRVR